MSENSIGTTVRQQGKGLEGIVLPRNLKARAIPANVDSWFLRPHLEQTQLVKP